VYLSLVRITNTKLARQKSGHAAAWRWRCARGKHVESVGEQGIGATTDVVEAHCVEGRSGALDGIAEAKEFALFGIGFCLAAFAERR